MEMIFNPDLTKQVQEVIFSRKLNKPVRPYLTFSNSQVSQTESQKHLGLVLDNKLNFHEDLKGVLDRISKTMGLICKFQLILSRFSLLTVDKTSWLGGHDLWSNLQCIISQKTWIYFIFRLFNDHRYHQRHFVWKVKSRIRFVDSPI